MTNEQITKRLVELCRKGEYEQAQKELFADDAASIEMEGSPGLGNAQGLPAIFDKGRQFKAMLEAEHGGCGSGGVVCAAPSLRSGGCARA